MANSQLQAGASIRTNGQILEDGGIGFDVQALFWEIATRFLHLVEGVLVIIIGIFVIRYARKYIQKVHTSDETQRMALNLVEKLVSGFLVVVTATLALKVVGLDLTLLVSALTLGLSFALGDIIKNYVSGILILFKSPFRIGDIVKIKSFTGRVERIDFQSTTMKTFDKKEITIYNKDILSQSITNYSKEDLRRLELVVTLGRGTDVPYAIKVFESILNEHPKVLKSPHFTIIVKNFADFGIKLALRFWVNRSSNILKVRSELAFNIEQAFDEQRVLSPVQRGIEFSEDVTMNTDRKQRLERFYGQPALAAIAVDTSGQLQTVLSSPDEDLFDREEPEV
ncbi:MAG: mechanosensitive ion channel family protein [Candidatus Altimarinota bacterium]